MGVYIVEKIIQGVTYSKGELKENKADELFNRDSKKDKVELICLNNYNNTDLPDYLVGIVLKVIRDGDDTKSEEVTDANANIVCYIKELKDWEYVPYNEEEIKKVISGYQLPDKPVKVYIAKYLI
jgi:hypothetical protein